MPRLPGVPDLPIEQRRSRESRASPGGRRARGVSWWCGARPRPVRPRTPSVHRLFRVRGQLRLKGSHALPSLPRSRPDRLLLVGFARARRNRPTRRDPAARGSRALHGAHRPPGEDAHLHARSGGTRPDYSERRLDQRPGTRRHGRPQPRGCRSRLPERLHVPDGAVPVPGHDDLGRTDAEPTEPRRADRRGPPADDEGGDKPLRRE